MQKFIPYKRIRSSPAQKTHHVFLSVKESISAQKKQCKQMWCVLWQITTQTTTFRYLPDWKKKIQIDLFSPHWLHSVIFSRNQPLWRKIQSLIYHECKKHSNTNGIWDSICQKPYSSTSRIWTQIRGTLSNLRESILTINHFRKLPYI